MHLRRCGGRASAAGAQVAGHRVGDSRPGRRPSSIALNGVGGTPSGAASPSTSSKKRPTSSVAWRPAVGLALDELLQHRRGSWRAVRDAGVLERAGHGRHARESDALGELPADLEVRVDARLRCAGTASGSAGRRRRSTCCSARPPGATIGRSSVAAQRREARRSAIAAIGAAPASRSAPARSSASSSARAKRSSSHASNSTPLRAPVIAREHRVRRVLAPAPFASPDAQMASGRKYCSRPPSSNSTSTIVTKSGCGAAAEQAPVDEPRAARRRRALPPNQRWRCRNGSSRSRSMSVRTLPSSSVSHAAPTSSAGAAAISAARLRRAARAAIGGGRLLQPEPVERVRAERQEVRQLADPRELGQAEHLDRRHALEARQVELDRLHACATRLATQRTVSSS